MQTRVWIRARQDVNHSPPVDPMPFWGDHLNTDELVDHETWRRSACPEDVCPGLYCSASGRVLQLLQHCNLFSTWIIDTWQSPKFSVISITLDTRTHPMLGDWLIHHVSICSLEISHLLEDCVMA